MATPTLDEFAAYVEDLPRLSPCWGDGILGLYPVLTWLNTHPVVVQREVVAEEGVLFGLMMTARAHHNQVGTAVAWATQYMVGPAGPVGTDPDDLPELLDLAGRAYLMRNLLAEVRQGVRRFEADENRIVMTFAGDPRLDALDRLLDLVEDITDPDEPRPWDPAAAPVVRHRRPRHLLGPGASMGARGVPGLSGLADRQLLELPAGQSRCRRLHHGSGDPGIGGAVGSRVLHERLHLAWFDLRPRHRAAGR